MGLTTKTNMLTLEHNLYIKMIIFWVLNLLVRIPKLKIEKICKFCSTSVQVLDVQHMTFQGHRKLWWWCVRLSEFTNRFRPF